MLIEAAVAQVETENSFDGCLMDIDDKFKQKVKELVPWLLAPENLVVKQINGQKVTCQEFLNYFRIYARTFQAGTLPPPESLLQVSYPSLF
ncbi:hypothetical protein V5799_027777 [Amblyomma americanum]|uniref:Uncharacterized protein n=1 Tax=Amblyomma americanum TaxID=6943 RepID=A0AAQ4DER6_AMBAM